MIYVVTIVFIGLTLFDLPRLIRDKHWRELIVYSILIIIAYLIIILPEFNVKLPNPVRTTQYYVRDLLPFGYE
jgi:hypothetical protein